MKRKAVNIFLTLSIALSALPAPAWAVGVDPDAGLCPHRPGHTEGCGIAGLVGGVQALIDALPPVEEVRAMDGDGQRAVYDQTQADYDAYQGLTAEQRGLITGTGAFEELFAFFNGQIMPLAAIEVSYVDAKGQPQDPVPATEVESNTTEWNASTTNGWYVVNRDVTIGSRVEVSGKVNLILADSGSLSAGSGLYAHAFPVPAGGGVIHIARNNGLLLPGPCRSGRISKIPAWTRTMRVFLYRSYDKAYRSAAARSRGFIQAAAAGQARPAAARRSRWATAPRPEGPHRPYRTSARCRRRPGPHGRGRTDR